MDYAGKLLSKSDVKVVPYNLQAVINSSTIFITEGEKDADRLIENGFAATTNCSGALNWNSDTNKYFNGKKVFICQDNDKAGESRTLMIGKHLARYAKTIAVLEFDDFGKGGDVSDYFDKYSREDFVNFINLPRENLVNNYNSMEAIGVNPDNSFFNFVSVQEGRDIVKYPKHMPTLVDEVIESYEGFPYRIGHNLFFYDYEDDKVNILSNKDQLKAVFLKRKYMMFGSANGYPTMTDLHESLLGTVKEYEQISYMPTYPRNPKTFYAHETIDLNEHENNTKYLDKFCSFFTNVDERSKEIMRSFVMAPMWYINGENKPIFIIDANEGQGSGKSTLVNMVAMLYRGDKNSDGIPLSVLQDHLKMGKSDEINKNILSTAGRQK